MDSQPPTINVTKAEVETAIEVALLKNNEHLLKEFRSDIDQSADKIAKSVHERTEPMIAQLVELAKTSGVHEEQLTAMKVKLEGLWAKFTGIAAAVAAVTALLTYLIDHVV